MTRHTRVHRGLLGVLRADRPDDIKSAVRVLLPIVPALVALSVGLKAGLTTKLTPAVPCVDIDAYAPAATSASEHEYSKAIKA
jgi:hypothetical protein